MDRPTAAGRLVALALGLCLAVAVPAAGAASDRAATADRQQAVFSISEGRAFGAVRGEALGTVLDVFVEAAGLSYKAPEELLGHPVSGRFAGEPSARALERMLRPFDYLAVYRGNGTVKRLTVRGLRSGARATAAVEVVPAPQPAPAAAEDLPEETEPPRPMTQAELIEEAEFSDIEALAKEAGVPLEALYDRPAGDGGEPRYNTNILEHLLQRRDAE